MKYTLALDCCSEVKDNDEYSSLKEALYAAWHLSANTRENVNVWSSDNETRPVAYVHRAFEDQFGVVHSRCAYLINDYGGHAINIEELED